MIFFASASPEPPHHPVLSLSKCVNDVTFFRSYITLWRLNWLIFDLIILNHCYAVTYRFTDINCRGCYPVVDKHLYPNGSQDQKHPQRGGCYSCYYLVVKGVWAFRFFEEPESITNKG